MLRIAQLITRTDNIGGAQVHVRDLSIALRDIGHQVCVYGGGEGPFAEEIRRLGLEFTSLAHMGRELHPYKDVLAVFELKQMLEKARPDLLACHSSKAGWIGRLVGSMLGIPVVFTAHGWSFTEGVPSPKRQIYLSAEKIARFFPATVITVSQYDKDQAARYGLTTGGQMETVHNGVQDVEQALRARPDGQHVRLAMVARFERPKAQDQLILALSDLQDLDWSLDLIGDGPNLSASRQLADNVGLSNRVRFLGARSDVAHLLAQAQVSVLASDWEGFPITILEAMRAGLPVVASNVGGVSEAVTEGVTGFLIPRGRQDLLRDRLRHVILNPSLRRTMGNAGREVFERQFTLSHMVSETLSVYEKVMAGVT